MRAGHGGGGRRLNDEGPSPLMRWIERFDICIVSIELMDSSE